MTACIAGKAAKQTSEITIRTDGAVVFIGAECGRNFGNLNGKSPICGPRNSRQLSSARTLLRGNLQTELTAN